MANYKYKIKNSYQPNGDILILELGDPTGAPIFDFKPGQYVMISYLDEHDNLKRKHAFSITSSPTETKSLRLGIKIAGKFTQGLVKLKPGETIFVTGPFGRLVFNEKKHQNLVVIAGGIGITPFFSTLKYVTDKQLPNKLFLIYSNRTLDRALFYQEICVLAECNQNIKTLFSITENKLPSLPKSLLTEQVTGQIIKNFVGEVENKNYFLCGPEKFMEVMNQYLLDLGVPQNRIEKEGFSMIIGAGFWAKLKNFSYITGFSSLIVLFVFYLVNLAASAPSTPSVIPANSTNKTKVNPTGSVDSNIPAPTPITSVSGSPLTNQIVPTLPVVQPTLPVPVSTSPDKVPTSQPVILERTTVTMSTTVPRLSRPTSPVPPSISTPTSTPNSALTSTPTPTPITPPPVQTPPPAPVTSVS